MTPPAEDVHANIEVLIDTFAALAARLQEPVSVAIIGILPYVVTPAQRARLTSAVVSLMNALESLQISLHRPDAEAKE